MSWDYHKYLHIYAQHTHHQESFIVGNKEALLELRNLIDQALKEGEAKGVFSHQMRRGIHYMFR